jgi:hypothetical protein
MWVESTPHQLLYNERLCFILRRATKEILGGFHFAGYDIGPGEEIKAFARLDRGPRYPVISAMSGYSLGHRVDVLNNEIWTGKAQDLCRFILNMEVRHPIGRGSLFPKVVFDAPLFFCPRTRSVSKHVWLEKSPKQVIWDLATLE